MEFELQYELDEFKLIQDQYFNEDNKCYTGVNLSTDIMEKMLSLIDNLSERVNELEPVIKQQIKKSLPIHGVVGSALLKDLLNGSEEVIAINGLRFTGTHEEKIKQVFDKHGVKYESPF